MKSLKYLLLAFTALNITACSFDKTSDTNTQQEMEDRAALYDRYNRVTGTYSGTAGSDTVRIGFFTAEKKRGETADGQPKFLPVLMARYSILNSSDSQRMEYFMEAKYIAETSEVFMSNAEGNVAVHAYFAGDSLNGEVTTDGIYKSTLDAKLVSREAAGENNPNARAERDARLRKLFEPIAGFYAGVLEFHAPKPRGDLKAEINIVVGQVKDKDGYFMPALQGSYRSDKDRELVLALSIDYKSDTNPPYISLVSTEAKADLAITISGTIQNGVITGSFSNKLGEAGTVRFVKQNP